MAKKEKAKVSPEKEEKKIVPKKTEEKVILKKEEPKKAVVAKGLGVLVEGVEVVSISPIVIRGAEQLEVKDLLGSTYIMSDEAFKNLKKKD